MRSRVLVFIKIYIPFPFQHNYNAEAEEQDDANKDNSVFIESQFNVLCIATTKSNKILPLMLSDSSIRSLIERFIGLCVL